MCDFRDIISIRVLKTGEVINVVDKIKNIYPHELNNEELEEGLYHIAASGSFHWYYDGKEWLGEKNDNKFYSSRGNLGWEVVDYIDPDPFCCFDQPG